MLASSQPVDLEIIQTTLKQLHEQLEELNPDAMETVEKLETMLINDQQQESLRKIKTLIDEFSLNEALEILETLQTQIG